MANYGHAAELQRTQPPLSRLEYLIRQLGLWADTNPALRSLHSEFVTIHHELRDAGAGDIPPEILPVADAIRQRACPECGAETGNPCHSVTGTTLRNYTHLARRTAKAGNFPATITTNQKG